MVGSIISCYINLHSVTNHTPEEALKQSNTSMVEFNLELKKEAVDDTLILKLAMPSEYSEQKTNAKGTNIKLVK